MEDLKEFKVYHSHIGDFNEKTPAIHTVLNSLQKRFVKKQNSWRTEGNFTNS